MSSQHLSGHSVVDLLTLRQEERLVASVARWPCRGSLRPGSPGVGDTVVGVWPRQPTSLGRGPALPPTPRGGPSPPPCLRVPPGELGPEVETRDLAPARLAREGGHGANTWFPSSRGHLVGLPLLGMTLG